MLFIMQYYNLINVVSGLFLNNMVFNYFFLLIQIVLKRFYVILTYRNEKIIYEALLELQSLTDRLCRGVVTWLAYEGSGFGPLARKLFSFFSMHPSTLVVPGVYLDRSA